MQTRGSDESSLKFVLPTTARAAELKDYQAFNRMRAQQYQLDQDLKLNSNNNNNIRYIINDDDDDDDDSDDEDGDSSSDTEDNDDIEIQNAFLPYAGFNVPSVFYEHEDESYDDEAKHDGTWSSPRAFDDGGGGGSSEKEAGGVDGYDDGFTSLYNTHGYSMGYETPSLLTPVNNNNTTPTFNNNTNTEYAADDWEWIFDQDSDPEDPYDLTESSDDDYVGKKLTPPTTGAPIHEHQLRRSARKKRPNTRFIEYQCLDTSEKKWDIPRLSRIIYERPFARNRITSYDGEKITFNFFRQTGFRFPFISNNANSIGIRLPSDISPQNLAKLIGPERRFVVRDAERQTDVRQTTTDWTNYFLESSHTRQTVQHIRALIANEITGTQLASIVKTPSIVRDSDWIDHVWPPQRKVPRTKYTESFHYPQVQLYFLAAAQGSFIDFHIDGGGTSAWYSVLSGEVTFLLVPPSASALGRYEAWYSSFRHTDPAKSLFADRVEDETYLVSLLPDHTLFIPTGWIYAIHCPKDSMFLNGLFMTSFNIQLQLYIHALEERIFVPSHQAFPYFRQIHWYAACYYLDILRQPPFDVSLYELQGISVLVPELEKWLESQAGNAPVLYPHELLTEISLRLQALATNSRPVAEDLLKHANKHCDLTYMPILHPLALDTPSPISFSRSKSKSKSKRQRKYEANIINPGGVSFQPPSIGTSTSVDNPPIITLPTPIPLISHPPLEQQQQQKTKKKSTPSKTSRSMRFIKKLAQMDKNKW